ncbi:hypothetical protein KAZ01_01115, partial [Candidatus Gracilibacteria bacterium]|nr:hypothetical protein [Candidatus Gracilibacteria bacterium]
YMTNDQLEFDEETQRLKDELNNHLLKFVDLDKLFIEASNEITYYFENQARFKKIDEFKDYLKHEIIFYVNSFNLDRSEKKKIRARLISIEENYDRVLYFGEHNPVETMREGLKQEEIEKKFSVVKTVKNTVNGIIGNK